VRCWVECEVLQPPDGRYGYGNKFVSGIGVVTVVGKVVDWMNG